MKPVTVKLGAMLLGLSSGLLLSPAGASDKIVFEQSDVSVPAGYLLFSGNTEESKGESKGKCITRMDEFRMNRGEIELAFNALPPSRDCPTRFTLFGENFAVTTFKPENGRLSKGESDVIHAPALDPLFTINLHVWILDCLLKHGGDCLEEPSTDANVVAFDAFTDGAYAKQALRESMTGVDLKVTPHHMAFSIDPELRQQKNVDCEHIMAAVKNNSKLMNSSDSALNVYYHKSVSVSAKYCLQSAPESEPDNRNALEKRGFILIPRGEVEETLTHEIGHFLDLGENDIFGNYMNASNPSMFRCSFNVEQVLKMRAKIDEWEGKPKPMSAVAPQGSGASESMKRILRPGGANEACHQMYERLAIDWVFCEVCSEIVLPPLDKGGVAVVEKVGRLLRGYIHGSELERSRKMAEKDWEELRDLVKDKPDKVKARFEQDAGGKEAFVERREKKIHDRYMRTAAELLGSCALREDPAAWKEAYRQLQLAVNPVPKTAPDGTAGDQLLEPLTDSVKSYVDLSLFIHDDPGEQCQPTQSKGSIP